ncbi:hypothetical protein CM49_04112 [Paenibacillus sp. P1XP2]|nr:hypothetical protein CM49_04112 [Paenibacillus sp. P1XP2]
MRDRIRSGSPNRKWPSSRSKTSIRAKPRPPFSRPAMACGTNTAPSIRLPTPACRAEKTTSSKRSKSGSCNRNKHSGGMRPSAVAPKYRMNEISVNRKNHFNTRMEGSFRCKTFIGSDPLSPFFRQPGNARRKLRLDFILRNVRRLSRRAGPMGAISQI